MAVQYLVSEKIRLALLHHGLCIKWYAAPHSRYILGGQPPLFFSRTKIGIIIKFHYRLAVAAAGHVFGKLGKGA